MPDDNSIFLLSVNEKGDRKEEMRKFLALPIDQKTANNVRMMAKLRKELSGQPEAEEEEKEKMKSLKQTKSKTALPKQTPGRHELKMAMMKRVISHDKEVRDFEDGQGHGKRGETAETARKDH